MDLNIKYGWWVFGFYVCNLYAWIAVEAWRIKLLSPEIKFITMSQGKV